MLSISMLTILLDYTILSQALSLLHMQPTFNFSLISLNVFEVHLKDNLAISFKMIKFEY